MPKKWTSELIIETIYELHKRGEDLSFSNVRRRHPGVFHAAISKERFGSWQKAVEAAGLDYSFIRKRTHNSWTKDSLIQEIGKLHKQGADLNTAAMQRHHSAIFGAAIQKHHFGNWRAAIEAAGLLEQTSLRFRSPTRRWTSEAILHEIRDIHEQGGDLAIRAISEKHHALYQSAIQKRYFGNWQSAVEAAGFDYGSIRKRREAWTPEALVRELQRLYEIGDDLKTTNHSNLYAQAYKHFGGWDNALLAAGINPVQLREVWTREKVISDIKKLAQHGHTLSWSAVMNTSPALYHNARRPHIFGSWQNAVAAAKEKVKPAPPKPKLLQPEDSKSLAGRPIIWSKEKVLSEIKQLHAAGAPLWKNAKCYPSLQGASRRHFGGWSEAIEAAGINLKDEKHQPHEATARPLPMEASSVEVLNREEVLEKLKRLHQERRALWKRAGVYPELSAATRQHFGTWLKALEAAGVLEEQRFLQLADDENP